MRTFVAEENGIAALGRHLQVHARESGSPAFFRFVEVHDHRADTLATPLQNGGSTWLSRIEIIVVGSVFSAGHILQHLNTFAVLDRPVDQPGYARFNTRYEFVLAALEEHSLACAVRMHFLAACFGGHRERSAQARPGSFNQCIALFVGEQSAEYHQTRQRHAAQHRDTTVSAVQLEG